MIPTTLFPANLCRLILFGGGGLPPAYGPICAETRQPGAHAFGVWDGSRGSLHLNGQVEKTVSTDWFLPTTEQDPWPSRFAHVAAAMAFGGTWRSATIDAFAASVRLTAWTPGVERTTLWDLFGSPDQGDLRLRTLVRHRQMIEWGNVALLLALYDVPAIKAHVDAVAR